MEAEVDDCESELVVIVRETEAPKLHKLGFFEGMRDADGGPVAGEVEHGRVLHHPPGQHQVLHSQLGVDHEHLHSLSGLEAGLLGRAQQRVPLALHHPLGRQRQPVVVIRRVRLRQQLVHHYPEPFSPGHLQPRPQLLR